MLEHTGALNPHSSKPDSQLTDRAVALGLLDLKSKDEHEPHWVGDRSKGVWHALSHSSRIQKLTTKLSRERERGALRKSNVTPIHPSEAASEGHTSYERMDGTYTAIWDEESEEGSAYEEEEIDSEVGQPVKKTLMLTSISEESSDGDKRPNKRRQPSRSPTKSKSHTKRSRSRSRSYSSPKKSNVSTAPKRSPPTC